MPAHDLDRLFLELRRTAPTAPDHLSEEILGKLGQSTARLRLLFFAGAFSCLAATLVSASISFSTAKRSQSSAPPSLALFSAEFSPVTSR